MWESIETHPGFLVLGLALIVLFIILISIVSSRRLTAEARKMRVRKFALIGAGIFFFGVPMFKPTVYPSSNAKYLDKIEVGELATTGQIEKFETDQTEQIEEIKKDIIEIRKDIHKINSFYSSIILLMANMLMVACFTLAFSKKKDPTENSDSLSI